MNRLALVGLVGILPLASQLIGCASPSTTKATTTNGGESVQLASTAPTCDAQAEGQFYSSGSDTFQCVSGEWIAAPGATAAAPLPETYNGTSSSSSSSSSSGSVVPDGTGPTGSSSSSSSSSGSNPSGATGSSGGTGVPHQHFSTLTEYASLDGCPAGGQVMQVGDDLDDSGTLDTENSYGANEVTNSWTTCYSTPAP